VKRNTSWSSGDKRLTVRYFDYAVEYFNEEMKIWAENAGEYLHNKTAIM
jgi:hypothetical protein